jgi:hypothetical protein
MAIDIVIKTCDIVIYIRCIVNNLTRIFFVD